MTLTNKKRQEESINKNDNPNLNLVCQHCENVCSMDEEFKHLPGCDGMDWDIVPTKEPISTNI